MGVKASRVRIPPPPPKRYSMRTAYCFIIHFRIVQGKFQRLDKILKQFPGQYNKKELESVRRAVQVLGRQNIRKVEKRIDALSAGIRH